MHIHAPPGSGQSRFHLLVVAKRCDGPYHDPPGSWPKRVYALERLHAVARSLRGRTRRGAQPRHVAFAGEGRRARIANPRRGEGRAPRRRRQLGGRVQRARFWARVMSDRSCLPCPGRHGPGAARWGRSVGAGCRPCGMRPGPPSWSPMTGGHETARHLACLPASLWRPSPHKHAGVPAFAVGHMAGNGC
eukprot:363269-Chlamydomonas_euryale.AAC.6